MTSLYQPITLIQEYYYIANDLTKLLPVLGFDLKACAEKKSIQNRWEIKVKHALQIYQNNCGQW